MYLRGMRQHMPRAHRAFVAQLEAGTSLRSAVEAACSNKGLKVSGAASWCDTSLVHCGVGAVGTPLTTAGRTTAVRLWIAMPFCCCPAVQCAAADAPVALQLLADLAAALCLHLPQALAFNYLSKHAKGAGRRQGPAAATAGDSGGAVAAVAASPVSPARQAGASSLSCAPRQHADGC